MRSRPPWVWRERTESWKRRGRVCYRRERAVVLCWSRKRFSRRKRTPKRTRRSEPPSCHRTASTGRCCRSQRRRRPEPSGSEWWSQTTSFAFGEPPWPIVNRVLFDFFGNWSLELWRWLHVTGWCETVI